MRNFIQYALQISSIIIDQIDIFIKCIAINNIGSIFKVFSIFMLIISLSACPAGTLEKPGSDTDVTEHSILVTEHATKVEYEKESLVEEGMVQPAPPPVQVIVNPPVDVWQRIREQLTMQHLDNPRIQAELAWYARHPKYMVRVAKRAEPYLFYIVNEIEKKNIPMEIALLPIVESAFDPFAYSHGRAAGIWQFIPSTGKSMGLQQNWWYDSRRDIRASTTAALSYLEQLTRALSDDWLLGLAAYNSGQRRVKRAIEHNEKLGKDLDFWSLRLPRETRSYVPKLIAVAKIIANPEDYKIDLPKISNTPYLSVVQTGGQIDLAQAAELSEVDIETIYLLNPAYNRWATSPDGPHELLVPVDKLSKFKEGLAALDKSERVQWTRYRIKFGDSLIRIASLFNTKAKIIREVNGLRNNNIRAGATLLIPTASAPLEAYSLSADQRLAKTQNRSRGSRIDYMVRPGDSFWSIARKYRVTTTNLARWNGLGVRDKIHPGQNLVIWKMTLKSTASVSVPKRKSMVRKLGYRVRSGDSLGRIANKFNVSVDKILEWNTLNKERYIQPGQLLTLYVDITGSR